MKDNRLTFLETDENLKVIIPPPRFSSPMTNVCILSDFLIAIPLFGFVYTAYYMDTINNFFLVLFSLPWISGAIVFNMILATCFLDKTSIAVGLEKINITTTFQRANKSPNSFTIEEIMGIKVVTHNKKKPKNNLPGAEIKFLLENEEYSIYNFTSFIFSNEEIILLANKLKQYTGKKLLFE